MARANRCQEPVGERIRVMAVAESRFAAILLQDALSRFPGCNLVSSLATWEEALTSAAKATIDVAVINDDLEGEHLRGLRLARQLSSASPTVKLVIKVTSPTHEVIVESFQSGAQGIFHDGEPLDALWECISRVQRGQIYATQTDISYAVRALTQSPPLRLRNAHGKPMLTKREQEVAQWVIEGHTNREIASKLGLSQHTIKNYLFRIFERLDVSSRAEMVFHILNCRPQADERAGIAEDSVSYNGSALSACLKEAYTGCANAQFRLGESYGIGEGVPEDAITSYMWLTLAEESAGSVLESARAAKERVARKLTRTDIAAARARAIKLRAKIASDPNNLAVGHATSKDTPNAHLDVDSADEDILQVLPAQL
jgi:two-component system nitrate/nitrite response regulator NarL